MKLAITLIVVGAVWVIVKIVDISACLIFHDMGMLLPHIVGIAIGSLILLSGIKRLKRIRGENATG